MISIVKQTIKFYLNNNKIPTVNNLEISDNSLLNNNWSIFVTLYKNGEVRWASWNIQKIESNLVDELIKNTIHAIKEDKRFKKIEKSDINILKVRIDKITERKILQKWELKKIDPTVSWVLAINKDYENMAVILPNINPILLTWNDLIPVLNQKLNIKNFSEDDFILYSIRTENINDF